MRWRRLMWHPKVQLSGAPPSCSQTSSCCFKADFSPHMWQPTSPLCPAHPDALHLRQPAPPLFSRRDSLTCLRWTWRAAGAVSESMPLSPNLPFIMLIWFPLMERFFKMASLYGFTYWLFNSWPSVLHHSCCASAARTLPDQRRMLLECGIDFGAVFCIFFFLPSLSYFVPLCECFQLHPLFSLSHCLPDGVCVFSC